MIKFDLDTVIDMAAEFPDKHKNSPIANEVEYLFEWLGGMRGAYVNGEVARVVNSLTVSLCEDEDFGEMKKSIRGIKSEDIAWIAAHFGFLYGMLYAANRDEF